jgi:hemolysin III
MIKGERFNSISHLVGAALALAGAAVLVVVASRDGDARRIVSFSIYGATLFLLYLTSSFITACRRDAVSGCFGFSITRQFTC